MNRHPDQKAEASHRETENPGRRDEFAKSEDGEASDQKPTGEEQAAANRAGDPPA